MSARVERVLVIGDRRICAVLGGLPGQSIVHIVNVTGGIPVGVSHAGAIAAGVVGVARDLVTAIGHALQPAEHVITVVCYHPCSGIGGCRGLPGLVTADIVQIIDLIVLRIDHPGQTMTVVKTPGLALSTSADRRDAISVIVIGEGFGTRIIVGDDTQPIPVIVSEGGHLPIEIGRLTAIADGIVLAGFLLAER